MITTCDKCGKTRAMAFKATCWACYQRDRRAKMPPKRVPSCVPSRRYHAYGLDDRCTHCGAKRLFG